MDYMSTNFGAGSGRSSRFPFRMQTNTQVRLNALPHAGGYRPTAGVGKYWLPKSDRWFPVVVILLNVGSKNVSLAKSYVD